MNLYFKYHNRSNNIAAIIVLIIYIAIIQMRGTHNASFVVTMTLIQMGIVLFFSIHRLFSYKNILDPGFWFTPLFSVVNLMVCNFIYNPSYGLSWYEPYRSIYQNGAAYYLMINATALIGFYAGNILIIGRKPIRSEFTISITSQSYSTLLKRLFFILFLAIIILYYRVFMQGGLNIMAENRGSNQFSYGGIGYLLTQISRLFYLISVSFIIPLLFMKQKNSKRFLLFFVAVSIYLIPTIYVGSRSYTIFLGIVLLINFFVFHKNPRSLISIKNFFFFLLSSMALITFFGMLRNIQGDSFSDYLLNFFQEMSHTSSVSMTTVHFFPNRHEYYYGVTYLSAFFNLVPNILFGGDRPFVMPAVVFHELFAPGRDDQGFGFSMLAEAYMNGGIWSVFLFFFFFSIFITSFFIKPKKSLVGLAMISMVFISTIWYLRADSTGFLKILTFAYLFFKVLIYRLGINKRPFTQEPYCI